MHLNSFHFTNHFMFRDAKQLLSGRRNLFLRRKHMSHAEYIKHLTKKKKARFQKSCFETSLTISNKKNVKKRNSLFITRKVFLLYQIFANLNCIQSRTLTNLIARKPECKAIIIRQVLTDTSHKDIVFSCSF